MRLAAALTLLLLIAAPANAEVKADQWIYREVDGHPGPVASFLSWDYRVVLFQASCEGEVLVLSYPGEAADETNPDSLHNPLAFVFAEGVELPQQTERKDGVRVGRLALTPGIRQLLLSALTINIEAGLGDGDPWYTGTAEPFKQLLRGCVV